MSRMPLERTVERLTQRAARWLEPVLHDGALAIDATVGNGYDTMFLAHAVGPRGRVLGFDVQKIALTNATEMLRFAGLLGRVKLVLASHEEVARHLYPQEGVAAAMFNLGYLPRGDRRIITRPESTLRALRDVLARLEPAGRATVLAYRAHPGGEEEYAAVAEMLAATTAWEAREVAGDGADESASRLFLIRRAG